MPRLSAALGWLGVRGGERLDGHVAVLSPHLDDAVLSLGAGIARARGEVAVVTVFAGDPDSILPAGEWDARAGFRTAGEAARARREEDALACGDIGARPVWLPFADHQYPQDGDEVVWSALEQALRGADTVLVPAFPLIHPDHVRLLDLVERDGLPGRRLGRYVEQPYASAWTDRSPGGGWLPLAAGLPERVTKLRACRRYASQLPLLGRRGPILRRMVAYEAARGGEPVKWS
ncbi:MAG TPA: PIG-L family deacetylase [Gaiellaceae bacterium]|nr:PIG-L family deacetylase [Gaiellaceae bacterium]